MGRNRADKKKERRKKFTKVICNLSEKEKKGMRKTGILTLALMMCLSSVQGIHAVEQQDQTLDQIELETEEINISKTTMYQFDVKAETSWKVSVGDDVSNWMKNSDGSEAFSGSEDIAVIQSKNDKVITIAVDASKITKYTNASDDYDLYIKPDNDALNTDATCIKIGEYVVPHMTIESHIFGSAYTYSKSTLKEALKEVVDYGDTSATISLDMEGLDNDQIDSNNATIRLMEGDGYYVNEYIFQATSLVNPWIDGQTTYALQAGDLEIDRSVYDLKDTNSGREWSCLGGDGSGLYRFHFMLEGVTYCGLPLPSKEFQGHVQIYGQDFVGLAGMTFKNGMNVEAEMISLSQRGMSVPQESEPVWTWIGDGNQPILCDDLADDFYITWPEGTNASDLKKQDISIVLTNSYGDVFTLNEDEFEINTSASETQIAVTLLYLPNTPVYTQMKISVNASSASSEKIYDIASVYVHETQQGGGGETKDGTVTAYSFYGLSNLNDASQIVSSCSYVLTYEDQGIVYYYGQDTNGNGILVEDLDKATSFDGNGVEDYNIQVINNTVYITSRPGSSAVKQVGNQTLTFTKKYSGGKLINPTDTSGLVCEDGYVLPNTNGWATHESWPWYEGLSSRWNKGWTGIDVQPEGSHFTVKVEKGASQQFTADAGETDVIWSIVGDTTDQNTKISENGVLTIGENETGNYFVVYAKAKNYTDTHDQGAVAINVIEKTIVVDKSELEDLVTRYQNIVKEDYTAQSYEAFASLYEQAKTMLTSDTVTQEEVDQLVNDLNAAYHALVKVDKEPQDTTPNDDSNDHQDDMTSPSTGDTTQMMLFLGLLLSSGCGIMLMRKKIRNQ